MKTVSFVLPLLAVVLYSTSGFAQDSFTSKLLHNVALQSAKKNFVISPVSIQNSLFLLYLGGGIHTLQEISDALIACPHWDSGHNMYIPNLRIVTGIFVDNQFKLAPDFKQSAKQFLRAYFESVYFGLKKATARRINEWVDEKTHQKIKQVIEPSSLDDQTAVVLVNTIYFKGEWLHSFVSVGSRQFHLNQKDTMDVEMMTNNKSIEIKNNFEYGKLDDLDATGLLLPYNQSLKMLIILPNSVDGLEALENKLQHIQLPRIADRLEAAPVRVFLPKFKIEYHTDLKELLKQFGIKHPFLQYGYEDGYSAFTRMTDYKNKLYVTLATHDAVIQVSEQGTEAEPATVMEIRSARSVRSARSTTSAPLFEHKFVADHPFFFAVIDKDEVFFGGHVVAP